VEALAVQEENARISEKALDKVSADHDMECSRAEATQEVYLGKMGAHIACAKHSFGLDKMLREKMVELDGREWDLRLREAALVEVHSQGINPWDKSEELMEFIKLQKILKDVEVERVTEVRRLVILARDVFKVLVNLDLTPIPMIPWDARIAGDILKLVGIILERLREAYAPVMALGIRRHPSTIVASIDRPTLVFCFFSFYFSYVKYFKDSKSMMILHSQAYVHHP
jgi:hypothetical protein